MLAGLAGAVTPATVFAAQRGGSRDAQAVTQLYAGATASGDKLVVSGRIVAAPDCKPLAGALVEAWHGGTNGDSVRASATTDADGRFMLTTGTPADQAGRPRPIHYRLVRQGHATPVRTLHFARTDGITGDLVAQTHRDDAGVWRASFGVTVA
jgi:protocatechuate 3,4-dioxygenase beta subunit